MRKARSSVILCFIGCYWHFQTTYSSHLRGPVGCPEIACNQLRTYVAEHPTCIRAKTSYKPRWKPEHSQLPCYLHECNRPCWPWVFHTMYRALYQRLCSPVKHTSLMNELILVECVANSRLRILVVTAGFNETTSNFFLRLSHILAGSHSTASSSAVTLWP